MDGEMDPEIARGHLSRRNLMLSTIAGAALGGTGALLAMRAGPSASNALSAGPQPIPVAFLIDENATIIDFCGPWEVFQDVRGRFDLFTVAPSTRPITATGGMRIVPRYNLDDAPPPKVIVIPAAAGGRQQGPATGAKIEWLRRRSTDADVVLSVCTGAFLLARTGLLDGQTATTHHDYLDDFAREFPRVNLQRRRRFVDNGKFVTAAGLTSGIDAALHIVSRYLGIDVAAATAQYMEYESQTWRDGAAAPDPAFGSR
jgi:transcriptional regulator GlxA family with amidase domain